jgi:hypothetical protein
MVCFKRAYGTRFLLPAYPPLEVAGYHQRSLRDLLFEPFNAVAVSPKTQTPAHSTLDRSIIASLSGDLCAYLY